MGKIVNLNTLNEIVASAHAHSKKIVFTNGCFDIIHSGHIKYLRQAKALGDILIIGLNSDSSVSRIKPKRPVNPESHRAEEMVDYVTLFDEDTPYELIKFVKPDILVKGGDWKKEDIVGSDIAKETHSLPYIEGVSTSEIIEKIKKL